MLLAGFDSVTVNTGSVALPSSTVMSLIWIVGVSSLTIVPTPCASAIVSVPTPPVGAVRLTMNVSLGSVVVSPLMVTPTVFMVWPEAKVSTVGDTAT